MNDGGPAFPATIRPPTYVMDSNGVTVDHSDIVLQGMSLRDYFAGQAILGMTMAKLPAEGDVLGLAAYEIADGAIAARSRNDGEKS